MQKTTWLVHLDSAFRTAEDIISCSIRCVSVVAISNHLYHWRFFRSLSLYLRNSIPQSFPLSFCLVRHCFINLIPRDTKSEYLRSQKLLSVGTLVLWCKNRVKYVGWKFISDSIEFQLCQVRLLDFPYLLPNRRNAVIELRGF